MRSLRQVFDNCDWRLTFAAVGASALGVALIGSVSWPQTNLVVKQAIFLFIGLFVYFFAQIFDRNFWRNASLVFYLTVVLLLVVLLAFGEATRGTRSWFHLGLFSLQPAEAAKIATVLFLARVLERLKFNLTNWRHILLALAIIAAPAALVLLQPDFGSAVIIAIASMLLVFYTGLPRAATAVLAVIGLVILAFGWGMLADYQRERILTFMNPQYDPAGAGYNVRQAQVAIGAGGLFGRGWGLGTQSQLNFLPEKETDFIFSVLAEEIGFLSALGLFALYILMFWRLWRGFAESSDLFANFLLLGIFGILLSQIAINIGMNLALLPVTGIPLPFLSYGGSSLLVSWFSLALAQSARREW